MRKIDKWVGVPLAFLFSIFIVIRDFITFRRKSKPDTKNSLFIELSEMGSAILVDPAMRKLRNYKNCKGEAKEMAQRACEYFQEVR